MVPPAMSRSGRRGDRTDAKPPLFANESLPKNCLVLLSVILNRPSERPPMTPSLTDLHWLAAVVFSNGNSTRPVAWELTGAPVITALNAINTILSLTGSSSVDLTVFANGLLDRRK